MNIIATIGPRNCKPYAIDQIIKGGCNFVRINISHGN